MKDAVLGELRWDKYHIYFCDYDLFMNLFYLQRRKEKNDKPKTATLLVRDPGQICFTVSSVLFPLFLTRFRP